MNSSSFLDLSSVSEEERRRIRTILADTSVVDIAEPLTKTTHQQHHNVRSVVSNVSNLLKSGAGGSNQINCNNSTATTTTTSTLTDGETEPATNNNLGSRLNTGEENKVHLNSSVRTDKVSNYVGPAKEQRSQEAAAKRSLDKTAGPRLAQKINSIHMKNSLPFLKPRGNSGSNYINTNKGNGLRNSNNINTNEINSLTTTTTGASALVPNQQDHQHGGNNTAVSLNVYNNHHLMPAHVHQVPPPCAPHPVMSTAKLDSKNTSSQTNNSAKNQNYHPHDTSNSLQQQQNVSTGTQPVPPTAQQMQPMPGDMNTVIGMDMASTQPPGYAISPHVTAFGPPPHHIYGGQPIFQPYHYLIHPYNIPSYMPYMLAPNSVVPPRQQVPPHSNQQPSTTTTTTSSTHARTHSNQISHHQSPDYSTVNHGSIQVNNNHQQANTNNKEDQQVPKEPTSTTSTLKNITNNIDKEMQIDVQHTYPTTPNMAMQHENNHASHQLDDRLEEGVLETHDPDSSSSDLEVPTTEVILNLQDQTTTTAKQSSLLNNKASTISATAAAATTTTVPKSVHAIETKNKNAVPNNVALSDRLNNQMLKAEANNLARSTRAQPSEVKTAQLDQIRGEDNNRIAASFSANGGDDFVKNFSDEGFETQSSLDVSKHSHESSIPSSSDHTTTASSSNNDSNKSSSNNDKLTAESAAAVDSAKDAEPASSGGGAWGSASSKSWASLFKSGGSGAMHSSALDGSELEQANSNSEISDEENKTHRSSGPVRIDNAAFKVGGSGLTKEQRSQEAAKRALDKMALRLAQRINSIHLKHSLPFLKPRGFINKGNGCYINATLQALIACPPFYNLMKEIGVSRREHSYTPILDSFAELFLNFPPLESNKKNKQSTSQQDQKLSINYLQAEAIEPKCIYNVLGQIKSEYWKGAQEDAEEFLSSVLNGLHEEMVGLSEILQETNAHNGHPSDVEDSNDDVTNDDNLWREVGPKNRSLPIRAAKVINTPIQEIFGGSLFSIRTAGKDRCGHRSPFISLQLDISGDNVKSVQDAIKSFTATEIIHDFYCSKTKQKLDAQRRTSLDQLPPILILHLKQFVYTQDHGLKKLIKKIEYPIDFELPENCLHEKNSADKNLRTSRSYKLLAVVYHDGKEAIKGHYLTDVYHIGSSQWIRCDDSNLKVIPSPRIENPDSSRTPYLLFYRRLNTLRAQVGNHDNKKKN